MNATQEARATLGMMNDADWCEFCTDFHTASCDDCPHGIPAAPELYEALVACRATVAEMIRDGRAHFNCDLDALERADAALAKAEALDA